VKEPSKDTTAGIPECCVLAGVRKGREWWRKYMMQRHRDAEMQSCRDAEVHNICIIR
jgi:hypothetical protein